MSGTENNLMHHKFCLIDTDGWFFVGTIITGSMNWTFGVSRLNFIN